MGRRRLLALSLAVFGTSPRAQRRPPLSLIKTVACRLSETWVEHHQRAGLAVEVRNGADITPTASHLGVPDALRSCYTAQAGNYAADGQVPAHETRGFWPASHTRQ